jgi:uncharacterized membrane protein
VNPIAIIHGLAALLVIGVSVPLIKRKVPRNPIYGVRIPEAFKSEERWLEINEYGGRLLLRWGLVVGAVSAIGLMLPQPFWLVYAFGALVVILGGLGIVVGRIFRYSARTKRR